jgi:hypothetical protein
MAYNYQVDSWGVFSKDYQSFSNFKGTKQKKARLSRYFLKHKYIINHPDKYDCFVLGSSRVEAIEAQQISSSCYNFTHPGATAFDNLRTLKLFLEHGVKIKQLFIAVDDITCTWSVKNGYYLMKFPHPASFQDWFDFTKMYLFKPFEFRDFNLINGHSPLVAQPQWIIDTTKIGVMNSREDAIRHYDSSDAQDERFRKMFPMIWFQEDNVDDTLEAIRELTSLAEAEGIDLKIFFNPIHIKTYLANDAPLLYRFKEGLASITPYYDFSGYNDITLDNRFWHETSHYNVLVGDQIIKTLLTGENDYNNFGQLITKTSVNNLAEREKLQGIDYFPQLLSKNKNLFIHQNLGDSLRKNAKVTKLIDGNSMIGASLSPDLFISRSSKDATKLLSKTLDPQVLFSDFHIPADTVALIYIDIELPHEDRLQVFWGNESGKFSNKQQITYNIKAERTQMYLPLLADYDVNRLRIDPGSNASAFKFHALEKIILGTRSEIISDVAEMH